MLLHRVLFDPEAARDLLVGKAPTNVFDSLSLPPGQASFEAGHDIFPNVLLRMSENRSFEKRSAKITVKFPKGWSLCYLIERNVDSQVVRGRVM